MSPDPKSNVESDAGVILRKIIEVGPVLVEFVPAQKWLFVMEFVFKSGGMLHATLEGRTYYEGLCRNPHMMQSTNAWKDEARSGMAIKNGKLGMVSRETKIKSAAIPGPPAHRSPRTPEEYVADMEAMRQAREKLCSDFEITVEQLAQYVEEGRVRPCGNHVGIFDKKGNRFQHLCRKCKKKKWTK